MAHFAKIDENNIVTQVLVIDQETINTGHFGDPNRFVQTSYNTRGGVHYGQDGHPDSGTPFRKNYAGIGYIYDSVRDAFYAPQPFPSWTLDEDTCFWMPPVTPPSDGKLYRWNEETLNWIEMVIN
jgi:hypothetical protein